MLNLVGRIANAAGRQCTAIRKANSQKKQASYERALAEMQRQAQLAGASSGNGLSVLAF